MRRTCQKMVRDSRALEFGMDRKCQKNIGRTRLCASLTMSAGAQGCTRTRLFRGGLHVARAGSHVLWHDRAALCALFSLMMVRIFFLVRIFLCNQSKNLKKHMGPKRSMHLLFLIQSGPSCHQTTRIDGKHLFTSDGRHLRTGRVQFCQSELTRH